MRAARIAAVVTLVGGWAGVAAAAPLDPEAAAPYRWRVAVRTGPHPAFGPAFRDDLGRQIRAALQASLGPAGMVEVLDLAAPPGPLDPLCRQFLKQGWTALDANPDQSPDPARVLTGVKTHFLTIDYHDGTFQLAARQHDGSTGIASPAVRRQATRSARMVPRLAGLLLEPDLGPVGTVEPVSGDPDHVTVMLRGHAAGPVETWVKPGDIFAVAVVKDGPAPAAAAKGGPGPVRTGTPLPHTLLKVVTPPQNGACRCLVLTRYQKEYAFGTDVYRKRAAGVRCLKLPTVEATVKLRLVNREGVPHARGSALTVAATDADFNAIPDPRRDRFDLRDGLFQSPRPLSNVACVWVSIGEGRTQLFPVPVLGGDPVSLVFDLKPEDEQRAEFVRKCNDLRGRIADVSQAQLALFGSLNRLIDAGRNREALAAAEGGFGRVAQAEQVLAEELKQVRAEPGAADDGAKRVLDGSDRQLAAIRAGQGLLTKRIADLKEFAQKSGDPAKLDKEFRAQELADRIREYMARGDVPEALDAYDQLIKLLPEDQSLKDKREKLLADWTPKDEEHRKARDAVRAWQQARTAEEFAPAVAALKPSVEVMRKKQDRLGLRKLLNTFEPAYAAVQSVVGGLNADTEDGAKALKELQKVLEDARAVEETARGHLKQLAPEGEKK